MPSIPKKICIVDDDNTILLVLKMTFEHAGYEVVSTNDPRNALPLLERSRPDAIVLDLMMPELSGWDVLKSIRTEEQFQAIPIVLLSALSDPAHRVRGLRSGADDYVVKPFDPDELVVRIEARISRKMRDGAGIEGRLEVQSIQEVVQSLENSAKTGALKIDGEGFLGTILLKDGKVASAQCGDYSGPMAVQTILELKSGRFHFTARPVDGDAESFNLMPLLMEEAWVTDELEARRAHRPGPNVGLVPTGELEEIPPEMAGFPLAEVSEYLRGHSGVTLTTLLEQRFDSPRRVQMVVAWMKEEGLLAWAAPPAAEGLGELDEDLDVVMRELFQDFLFRGFSLDQLEIKFLVQAAAWDSLAPMLVEIADPLLDRGGRKAKRRVFLDRGGKLSLAHDNGRMTLTFETLDPESAARPLGDACAVVLWLEENASGISLAAVASQIEASAHSGAGLLFIAPTFETRQRASRIFGEGSGWRLCEEYPLDLRQMFSQLLQAEPGNENRNLAEVELCMTSDGGAT